jgi:1-aminocyclopropane-1-carboxylate deaminase/D-cysteine desulfhydrase-like pyridoxal-dependent ACC family enzyme
LQRTAASAALGAGVVRDLNASLDDRVELVSAPTPLERADRLASAIGLAPGHLWVKREDAIGLAGGGNKVRKLEYLCAEALAGACDVVVTGGGPQSNHVRLTAAACARLGLECVAVVAGNGPAELTGNVILDHLLGAQFVWAGNLDYYGLERAIQAEVDRLAKSNRHPYLVPVGGASVTGTLGYVRAGLELTAEAPDLDLVVTPDGSGGTHAGLVAALGDHCRVLGVDAGTRPDLDERVPEMAAQVAAAAGRSAPTGEVQIDHDRVGAGYGAPTDACLEALHVAARTEGLILDPVYSGKALAGLIAAVRAGRIAPADRVVFVHTGGTPALFSGSYGQWIARLGP